MGPDPIFLVFAGLVVLLLGGVPQGATAQGTQARVELDSGDVLIGHVVSRDASTLVLDHPLLGTTSLPLAAIKNVTDLAPDVEATVEATPTPEPDLWSGEIAAGFDGNLGNTERAAIRMSFGATREDERRIWALKGAYNRAGQDDKLSESRGFLTARHDWLLEGSPWSMFATATGEIDEFREYDYRVNALIGPGYRFIKNETTRLGGRLGAGAFREIGGSDNGYTPELLVAADLTHAVTKRHKLIGSIEVFPNLAELGKLRAVGRATWDIALDEAAKFAIRFGIEDRLDTDADASDKPNDLDYFGELLRSF